MPVYFLDNSAQAIACATILRQKLRIKLSTSPSHSILTPGQPVPALTLSYPAPSRAATGVPIFKSLVWLNPEKSQRKWELNPGSAAPKADALTTTPTRWSKGLKVQPWVRDRMPLDRTVWVFPFTVHSSGTVNFEHRLQLIKKEKDFWDCHENYCWLSLESCVKTENDTSMPTITSPIY